MSNDNSIKMGTVLHIVTTLLLAVLGYLWSYTQTEISEIKCKLRIVELNTVKLLTITDTPPVASYQLPWPKPGETMTVELIIIEKEPGLIQAARKQGGPLPTDGSLILRNPGPL